MGVAQFNVPARLATSGMAEQNPELVVSIRGFKGKTWFVDSNKSSGVAGSGASWDDALLTIVAAHALAAADDLILVAPAHVETVISAAQLLISKAGLTIIGMGVGNRRPQINFTTVVGASVSVTGANTRLRNLRLTGGIDALTGPLSLDAAGIELIDIVTEDVTGQATDFIVTTDNCDRLYISGWQHRGAAAAGADTAISLVGGDDWVIEDFELYGNFAVAGIENVTTASNRVRVGGGARQNYVWTEHANDILVTMVATSTGWIGPNINGMLQDNAANITEAFAGAAMQFMQPIAIVNLAGESSMNTNITASTDA